MPRAPVAAPLRDVATMGSMSHPPFEQYTADKLPSHLDESERRWDKARDTYYSNEYHFKGFESLHALSLQYYEKELLEFEHELAVFGGLKVGEEEEQLKKLRKLLKEYSEGLQNLQNVLQREAILPGSAPIGAHPQARRHRGIEFHKYNLSPGILREPFRSMLYALTPGFLQSPVARAAARKRLADAEKAYPEVWRDSMDLRCSSLSKPNAVVIDTFRRFTAAITGGALVLVPMLVMSYRDSMTVRMVVASVAILLVGFILAVGIKVSFGQLLAITAGYASVMVVYVGSALSQSPSPSSGHSS